MKLRSGSDTQEKQRLVSIRDLKCVYQYIQSTDSFVLHAHEVAACVSELWGKFPPELGFTVVNHNHTCVNTIGSHMT